MCALICAAHDQKANACHHHALHQSQILLSSVNEYFSSLTLHHYPCSYVKFPESPPAADVCPDHSNYTDYRVVLTHASYNKHGEPCYYHHFIYYHCQFNDGNDYRNDIDWVCSWEWTCVCVCVYIYIYIYVCVCVYIYIYIYVCVVCVWCVYIYIYIYIYIYTIYIYGVCVYIYIYIYYIYIYVCVCVCVYIYIYIYYIYILCVCVCIYIYIYIYIY